MRLVLTHAHKHMVLLCVRVCVCIRATLAVWDNEGVSVNQNWERRLMLSSHTLSSKTYIYILNYTISRI